MGYGSVHRRYSRFVWLRSAGEIGINIFFGESHELLLLSEEIGEARVHCYVQYAQRGLAVVVAVYVQGRRRDASDLMKVVHIKGP